ncbi:Regulatory protein soxS [Slackia heliotrinireducens]|uniref:DNA-binding domain-containing protein, AraC-type n=1 Tax=Slackia heliotrinireducens (strain ATCC 29202 / DSM 20476 / NCTC 11029 / RHS 1) TaxID=471855 RepID=C7N7A8_SLAHD|nr:AraC family transcriptional regulator [Slackia heliotrinireducens]ACV22793.1 DNA-binding domain-containing protein, AraC-type [Slackia heliotrinireducens DSM 20476]VEH01488.1 Regulatory protein soxS [Slackia heliotrinireducens]
MIDYVGEFAIPEGWAIETKEDDLWVFCCADGDRYAHVAYYSVVPGVLLLDIDLKCHRLPQFELGRRTFMTVNWCTQGRCEASSPQRGSTVVDEGLLCISSSVARTCSYPTGSYRGYELVVELDKVMEEPGVFGQFGIRFGDLEKRLCRPAYALTVEPPEACRHAMRAIEDILDAEVPDRNAMRAAVCLLLAGFSDIDPARSRVSSSYLQKSQRELAQMLHDAILEDPTAPLPVSRIANAHGISEASLRGYFGRIYGTTPTAFARGLAMGRAAKLLANTDEPVGDVALSCGYVNPSKFSAAFKKEFDVNPLEYRRRSRLESRG